MQETHLAKFRFGVLAAASDPTVDNDGGVLRQQRHTRPEIGLVVIDQSRLIEMAFGVLGSRAHVDNDR